jgi:hypothetical protein
MRSASIRSCSNSFEASGRLAVPVRFMWLHTNSSGFNSGAYPGRKYNFSFPLVEVVANERALRATQDELEAQSIAAPASNWEEAADKVRYLLSVLAAMPSGQDPRRKILIQAVLDDFSRLSGEK